VICHTDLHLTLQLVLISVWCMEASRSKIFASNYLQVEPSSEMRKLLQAASKLQKKKGDSYLGASAVRLC
jgi:hypothetical protein